MFVDAAPERFATWLQDALEPGDRCAIRVVPPDALRPGEARVA